MAEKGGLSVEDRIAAALPEDAPAGHEAYKQVTYMKGNKACARFSLPEGWTQKRFQATLVQFGSQEACMRVCRAMYLKFQEGHALDVLKAQLAVHIEAVAKARAGDSWKEKAPPKKAKTSSVVENAAAVATEKKVDDTIQLPVKEKEKKNAAASVKPTAPAGPPDDAYLVSLLPQELSRVAKDHMVCRRPRAGLVYFEYMQGSVRQRMQTITKECGGSIVAAEHVCRLMLAKLVEGQTREEVTKFRASMYDLLPTEAAQTKEGKEKKQKKDKSEKKEKDKESTSVAGDVRLSMEALREKLQAEGRLETAVQVQGRGEGRKNNSINGVYAETKGGFEGKRAWEKVDGSTVRMLFYSTRKARWKINFACNDTQGGFAFAKIKDGDAIPGGSLRWQVFEGSDIGYKEDAGVSCTLLSGESPPAKKEGEEAKPEDDDGDKESASGSDSEAGSSSYSGGESEGEGAEETIAMAGGSPAASPFPAVVTPVDWPKAIAKIKGRACAKMLSRSGLRCTGHFAYTWDCEECSKRRRLT